ncbi:MAG: peptidoglycan recognition family protein [Chiayiivirga sp.]|jgi:N-acetyl-anhydromuramyl-L-alanine amidase AmpD|nr:peptidoglycan recognition family protein [Chiayiivirga sp.]
MIRTRLLASLALALGFSSLALAAGPGADAPFASPGSAAEEAALASRLASEEVQLRAIRAELPALFAEAYASYPQIPAGTLEAIAYSQSRWMPLAKGGENDGHHHMPTAHGVMGLYAGEGFTNQIKQAQALLGVSAHAIATDSRWNILAAAALLAREIDADGLSKRGSAADPEAIAPALARYAGLSPMKERKSAIDEYARQSFAFDVLLAMDRGINDKGMVVPERAVEWEKAFPMDALVKLRAPFVRLDATRDSIDVGGYAIDPISETLVRTDGSAAAKSTDYGPAIWNAAYSGNYTASRSQAISAVTIHTTQGSYSGAISWFKNASAKVSAHYVIRSSDGQVTQMVRDAHTAWHVGSQNGYTLGIEHEGYVSNSSWYTTAMYNASAALVRHMCAKYSAISCASAYKGAASSGINVLATSVKVKGHQHYAGQTHTDPGIYWNWGSYYNRLNPGSGGPTGVVKMLDTFESSVGHFTNSPAYSGSTTGISTASTALRDCSMRRNGNCSLQVKLVDNASSSAAWAVRLLSGGGSPSANTSLSRANGKVGFWVYSGGTGLSAALGIDDSDGTERSITRAIPANTWTYLEWSLTDAAQWNPWVGGNGAITASSVTLDAVWLFRAQTAYNVFVYIDDVQIKN